MNLIQEDFTTSLYKSTEISRNIILCSYSRFYEFERLVTELVFLKDYEVRCDMHVSHDSVYIADSEGVYSHWRIDE